jgi:CubicO group peptidase (beta-lactamase class C family)
MSRGLSTEGVEALDETLARHVDRGDVPGLVALVARGDDLHVAALGHKAFGDAEPIGRDAIFRIASITKPVAGVAAMLLLEDGAMALDDPVRRWLPELAAPRVLRSLESGLGDTVSAERPITVEDVLSFHLGFGSIMAPGPFPIQRAESELGLKTLGPPWPPPDLTPDQWIAGLGSLPLIDQPGSRWRYNTGASVAGVLIERVAGAPIAEVLRERVFEPLGMADTGFWVPAAKRDRFTTFYVPDGPA